MSVFVFPGQGSQVQGMGRELFDSVSQFVDAEDDINDILGYSLRELCLHNRDNLLQQTQYTQTCLYVVNALHYFKATAAGRRPAYLAGHSLGEYTALLAAGAFGLLDGLRLVKRRGELMAQARQGGMAAVLGLSAGQVARVLGEHGLSSIDVANFNSPTQVVISGPSADIQRAGSHFTDAGARLYVPLQVSAAFHSRYMADAAEQFSVFLEDFTFQPLRVPVVANLTGRPYPAGDPSKVIRPFLAAQIARPVLWNESLSWLIRAGQSDFVEMGPGQVLSKLAGEVEKSMAVHS
ncbi:ACP S-malonyltransferase [Janthinobacterium fluminis]|uniref:Malonyl CoA-acyl carrier protein transacylase n=1 Tax=Janthinobacterium fluminis TaxID=2987524 RepID=A0ABT5K0B9_9BURK|nr:ACP S-malonyltransferase [Janthinobacterium fluminis]MDC8758423.1 ACP S-malonyltransferase [Janthinobacterium fluminis]